MGVKNAFAKKLLQTKEKSYTDGVWDGMRMGFDIVAIALNHLFGFGNDRISRLEKKVQELVNEIVDTNDPVVTQVRIDRSLKQIRGKEWKHNG